ncbi:LytTr DNA-binding domain-containing protein [Dyadobacter jejuensis]|uniref:LytTr DNA-binding domain-containing protein n=1 Tax=Dyadobacter jejuensis TaxID=1082580 RepID=A0A316AVB9_9BACT|nr:LytTR family DNA-binding domain-containing protein [Dyadobacter jejuensis]PWJ60640.1 LytTr DNA-binding domain-containing protein [Dyadobacter jejuensis]
MENYTISAYSKLPGSGVSTRSESIAVQTMGHTSYIPVDVIVFLQGEGNYSYIYTSCGKRYLVSKTLKSLSESLTSNFIRVHKSYLVNAKYVVDRTDDDRILKLAGGREVVVARRKIKEVATWLDHKRWRISA